ncbi:Thylakoid lumenal 17.4 kDa protein, chloroplastic, partial [Linum grandiflorum]
RLLPLSTEPDRCEKAYVGNKIGQANCIYDKPIDLRFCDFSNDKSKLKGKSLAAALMVLSMDFPNAVLHRENFGKANLKGVVFRNTMLPGSTFEEAEMGDVVFEDTITGYIDLEKMCRNMSISADGRAELGCR